MAKVCKFCATENKDKEEFCEKCGAKLPDYRQYEAGLMNEMGNYKPSIFANKFKYIFWFVLFALLVGAVFYVFSPRYQIAELPDYNKYATDVNTIEIFVNTFNESKLDFASSVNTNSKALSLYISSYFNPAAIDPKKSVPNLHPRIIITAPEDEVGKLYVSKYSKIFFIPIRLKFSFSNKNSSWETDKWQFCNLPASSIFANYIFKFACKNIKKNKKLKKLLSEPLNIQRTTLDISISTNTKLQNQFPSIKRH